MSYFPLPLNKFTAAIPGCPDALSVTAIFGRIRDKWPAQTGRSFSCLIACHKTIPGGMAIGAARRACDDQATSPASSAASRASGLFYFATTYLAYQPECSPIPYIRLPGKQHVLEAAHIRARIFWICKARFFRSEHQALLHDGQSRAPDSRPAAVPVMASTQTAGWCCIPSAP